MSIANPLSKIKSMYLNAQGFRSERKIVVFESDDWGSIRMPSSEAFENLNKVTPITNAFIKNDCIESSEDLTALFSVLRSFKDYKNNHPCITANFAVANPDFDNTDYLNGIYNYETFTKTYQRLYGLDNNMLSLINEGISDHVFKPQLHAREHLNVSRWMRDLKSGNPHLRIAFENRTLDTQSSLTPQTKFGYMDSLNYDTKDELKSLEKIITDAANIFCDTFGYRSETFIASCFIWSPKVEKFLKNVGIQMLQTDFYQSYCPADGTSFTIRKPHYTGQKNRHGQIYSVRNCEYEPVYDHNLTKRVEKCLMGVQRAFENKKPAIIDTHRVNYIGTINPENAKIGREGLFLILEKLLKAYPDIEFLSSDELCRLMLQQK